MRLARLRHLVVAKDDKLVGLLSYRSLLESLLDERSRGDEIGRAMIAAPAFLTPETPLAEAADRICRYGFGCLPVVEQGESEARIVGLVTETDLLRVAFRR